MDFPELQGAIVYIYEEPKNPGCDCSGEYYFPDYYSRFQMVLSNYGCSREEFTQLTNQINSRWSELIFNNSAKSKQCLSRCFTVVGILIFLSSFIAFPLSTSSSDSFDSSFPVGLVVLPLVGIVVIIIGVICMSTGRTEMQNARISAGQAIQREILDPFNTKGNLVWTLEVATDYAVPVDYRRRRRGYGAVMRRGVLVARPKNNPVQGGIGAPMNTAMGAPMNMGVLVARPKNNPVQGGIGAPMNTAMGAPMNTTMGVPYAQAVVEVAEAVPVVNEQGVMEIKSNSAATVPPALGAPSTTTAQASAPPEASAQSDGTNSNDTGTKVTTF
eukprot:CAMPEP_0184042524 /NCGR_PEP_ID=MMETSP0955-20130417/66395_1 /TAXON_ID=627963 /ORGANISM="Aplanochytrium sp, Strain PBS07" /LENGTH=328 /DNA_ID=CAMNT_0026333293 /DNA_START=39 /DNA_END=1026 /DNA_ORIENTATION=-